MRWSEQKANDWREETDWIVGFNYVTSTAVNAMEMWQSETYDRLTIQKELELAAKYGFNSCRVFLQFLLWEYKRDEIIANLTDFIGIAASNGISVMPVLFDDCAFSGLEPYLGEQKQPRYGVHNSQWIPSPGPSVAEDPLKEQALSDYVKDVINTFKHDRRIVIWDLYNEPGNNNRGDKCLSLLHKAFEWGRSVEPVQPLTAGMWEYKDYDLGFVELSDVISYHDYFALDVSEQKLEMLKKHNRPLICTEWLHRPNGNNFKSHLPMYRREGVGVFNWGLVTGRAQTNLNWSTMTGEPDAQPDVWQQDLFHQDGTPYDTEEMKILEKVKNDE